MQPVQVSRRGILLLLGSGCCRLKRRRLRFRRSICFLHSFSLWNETNRIPSETRAGRFLRFVVQPNIDLYDAFTGTVSLERATRYIERVEPLVTAIDSLHSWVAADFDTKVAAFQRELPDFTWQGSIVFMPNLFVFDAGGGSVNGKDVLVFGLDTIAKMDGPRADLSVLISHELFHIYHSSFHSEWNGQSLTSYRRRLNSRLANSIRVKRPLRSHPPTESAR